jgi:hypothetical protein
VYRLLLDTSWLLSISLLVRDVLGNGCDCRLEILLCDDEDKLDIGARFGCLGLTFLGFATFFWLGLIDLPIVY